MRLSSLDLGWFLQDQVRDGVIALRILRGQEFPLVGPLAASGTFKLGPFFYYLLAIPYAYGPNPATGVAFLNLLNLMSIYLTYRLGTKMFGSPVGLVAAALYAAFPMAVFSGRALWNPGFVPFFTSLFLLTLWRFLTGRKEWTLSVLLVLLAVFLQIHASAIIFAVLLPVALWLYRPPLRPAPLVAGVLGAAVLYAPYVFSEFQHGLPDVHRLFAFMEENVAQEGGQPLWVIAARGLWIPFLLPERMMAVLPGGRSVPVFPIVQRAELALLAMGLVVLGVLLMKAKDRRPYVLLALWLVLPFLVVPPIRTRVMWYYFDVLYPAQFLVIGLTARLVPDVWQEIRSKWFTRRRLRFALSLLIAGLIVVQVYFMTSFARAVSRAGVLRFTTGILLSFPDPWWRMETETLLETIPLRFSRALAERFRGKFGVDHIHLERTGHGGVYQQFREGKGYSFLIVSPTTPAGPFDPSLHYLILRKDTRLPLEQGKEVGVGPYTIVGYHPLIRYESWRWSGNPRPEWWRETFDDSAWAQVTLPARRVPDMAGYGPIPYTRWAAKRVAFRGWMMAPAVGAPLRLVLNIRDDYGSPHQLAALYVNDRPIEAIRTVSYNSVISHNIDVIADCASALRPGLNLVAFEISGPDDEFDLDLYELRLTSRSESP